MYNTKKNILESLIPATIPSTPLPNPTPLDCPQKVNSLKETQPFCLEALCIQKEVCSVSNAVMVPPGEGTITKLQGDLHKVNLWFSIQQALPNAY